MSLKIKSLRAFERELKRLSKRYSSIKKDFRLLLESLLQNPKQGLSLGKDLYKIRMAISSKSQGKSGGARVVTCIKIENETIFLIAIYDKSDCENITDDELRERLKEIN